MQKSVFALFAVLAACAGKTNDAEPAPTGSASSPDEAALSSSDLTKTWNRATVLEQQLRIFRGANGYYAFTSRQTGDGKSALTYFTAVYQSSDAVTWNRVAMLESGTAPFQQYADVAYGGGHFVAAGWMNGSEGMVATSTDGALWSPGAAEATGINAIAYANDRFFAGSSPNDFQVSRDATHWTTVTRPLMQMSSAAYGNGAYVVFGACGMMTSLDGASWTDTTPDCSAPGAACISPPGGGTASACAYLQPGFFGAGKFWVMGLSSADGKTWTPASGAIPTASAGGYLFDDSHVDNDDGTVLLKAWQDGEAPTTLNVTKVVSAEAASGTEPATITLGFPNGATCNDHRCIVVGRNLYLIE